MAKRLITVFLFGLFIVSCSDVSEIEKCLDLAEFQMTENPEAAADREGNRALLSVLHGFQ